jgi:peptide-methionine (S)-S-oxide reductase
MGGQYRTAVLGGGCFWCTEAVFRPLGGVVRVLPGYAGGARPSPTYEQVCSGATGHAEVVEITFDPALISYEALLEVFFATHDPTTLNRQGHDVGTQYRSVIFASDEDQFVAARRAIADLATAGIFPDPIVTRVEKLDRFWMAEPEHHDYFARNPAAGYCQAVIAPKVGRLRLRYSELLAP